MKKILITFLVLASTMLMVYSQTADTASSATQAIAAKKKSAFIVSGGIQYPSWVSLPCNPVSSTVESSGDAVMAGGYFFGFGILYPVTNNMEVGLLGEMGRKSADVAFEGEASSGGWVLVETGSHETGVFPADVKYFFDAVSIRAAVRFVYPGEKYRLWGGIAPGIFSVNANFLTAERDGTYGEYSKGQFGITYQVGIDLLMGDIGKLTIFGDLASPVVATEYTDLFGIADWSARNHIMSPYRFGIALTIQ
ncbi:MAG: hypothetical protein P1P86_15955 [Bacteroidales bacterium]|nr:hypothetical protein [Bacteroidales bacterium]